MNVKKITLIILIAIALIVLNFLGRSGDRKNEKLTILVTGILQGYISPIEIRQTNDSRQIGGLHFLGSSAIELKTQTEAEGGSFLWVDNGDNFSGTPDSYYTQGEAVARIMDCLPFDAVTLGNREFDYGRDVLSRLIAGKDM
ncbi:MAG: hypothetical protein PHQ23_17725, partial [Candidatus Wallbacteria bacterium]|nr:hypothetical protein [Candidatus Wallbacteria bacterium]